MAGMKVEAIAVGPGQHDHIIERMIRQLKETVWATIASLLFQVPDILMPHLVVSCTKKLILFPSITQPIRPRHSRCSTGGKQMHLKTSDHPWEHTTKYPPDK